MRKRLWSPLLAIQCALCSAGAARCDDRSLVVLFGPTGEDTGRQAAHAVADSTHDWLINRRG
jgi:hypothetical protein